MCLSLAELFLLCALLTVVVHSFVANSSLLDFCDLVMFICLFVFFFLLPPYAWGFEVISAVLFLSFGVSCLLD